jgi:hypothetical protein
MIGDRDDVEADRLHCGNILVGVEIGRKPFLLKVVGGRTVDVEVRLNPLSASVVAERLKKAVEIDWPASSSRGNAAD